MSSSPNPFAPPGAVVSDINLSPEAFQPVRVFSIAGRMGRLRYLAYVIGASLLISFVGGAILGAIGAAMNSAAVIGVGTVLMYGGILVLSVMFLIQRSHDMDLSGWFSVLAFIPLVGLYWLFKGVTPGPNRFGPPPPPNTLGVKILAWILPVILIIGILAAIALPAYSDYTKRAKAAQMK